MQPVNLVNQKFNTIRQPQLKPQSQVNFGNTPNIDELRAKQDEFQRMAANSDEKSFVGKLGKYATKIMTIAIAFTATKLCLDKVAGMLTGAIGKVADKAVEKATTISTEKASEKVVENVGKAAKILETIKKSNIDKYIVNTIAGGATIGVAMKELGLVNKNVSVDKFVNGAVDNTPTNDYNNNNNIGTNDIEDNFDDEFNFPEEQSN